MSLTDREFERIVTKVAEATGKDRNEVFDEGSEDPEEFAYTYRQYLTEQEFRFLGGSPI